jgi:hypothetical protein
VISEFDKKVYGLYHQSKKTWNWPTLIQILGQHSSSNTWKQKKNSWISADKIKQILSSTTLTPC